MSFAAQITEAAAQYEKPAGVSYSYGTAGFRMKADLLPPVVFRVGLVAALRSRKLNGQTVGVMITASHNIPSDNGVKLVDPLGEMLESSWEAHAMTMANASSEEAASVYQSLVARLNIREDSPAKVVFARDTRASGPTLVAALKAAMASVDVVATDHGIMTTPQLHYIVRCTNTADSPQSYGPPTESGYYEKLSKAFAKVMSGRKSATSVTVDCANGVGGPKLHELVKYLPDHSRSGVCINVVNDDVQNPESLNVGCGADFVKTQQRAPPSLKVGENERYASLDGDADRIVYYFIDSTGTFRLLDGDRIATLVAGFLADQLRAAGLSEQLSIGVVQTAYANGASTEYIKKVLGLPVVCTPTGVKHLHHAAMSYDVGVYFEANGHGTVLFSSTASRVIGSREPRSPAQQTALETLRSMLDLINQTVGDALSDLLLVETVLAHRGWTCDDWLATYTDLPNLLLRAEVQDRTVFRAVDAERRLESPAGIQDEIDEAVRNIDRGRSFARASGTENAVRVYAEAGNAMDSQKLGKAVLALVETYGGKAKSGGVIS